MYAKLRGGEKRGYIIELVERLQFKFHLSAYFEYKIHLYGHEHVHRVVESFPPQQMTSKHF